MLSKTSATLAVLFLSMSAICAEDVKVDAATKLKETIVTFDCTDKPLETIIKEIATAADVPITLDPAIPKESRTAPINLRVAGMKADVALGWILKLSELESMTGTKGVYISTPDGIKAKKEEGETTH